MLEVIRERAQGWFAKIILLLITVPFALWGVESYLRGGGDNSVATVGELKISAEEVNRALRQQQDELRAALGKDFSADLLDAAQLRQGVVDQLVTQRLLLSAAQDSGMVAGDRLLVEIIGTIDAFQENGKFSKARYEYALRQQNMTPEQFEAGLRQDVILTQLRFGLIDSALVPGSVAERIYRINEEKREYAVARLPVERFLGKAQVSPDEVRAHYEQNAQAFRTPERVRLEYMTLAADRLADKISVSDEEVRRFYEEQAERFRSAEERQASHVLIKVDAGADKQAARKRAEEIAAQARAKPGAFAELARQHSQDSGSAGMGGELGWFGKGLMTKPFEDAVFAMKTGEIRGPVETEFGWHVIRLDGVRGGDSRPFDAVRGELTAELKKQKAARRFAELAENFANQVYEQSDSLKPAAETLGLAVQDGGWLARDGSEGAAPLNQAKVLQAAFSDDVLIERRNSEAIDIGANTLVAVRVAEHQPAASRPLEAVAAEITARLLRQRAGELAQHQGEAWLADLRQGKAVTLDWSASQEASRQQAQGLNPAGVVAVFGVDVAGRLPAYAGATDGQGGYVLYRVTKVTAPPQPAAEARRAYIDRLRQAYAQEAMAAYVASLKQRYPVRVSQSRSEDGSR